MPIMAAKAMWEVDPETRSKVSRAIRLRLCNEPSSNAELKRFH